MARLEREIVYRGIIARQINKRSQKIRSVNTSIFTVYIDIRFTHFIGKIIVCVSCNEIIVSHKNAERYL